MNCKLVGQFVQHLEVTLFSGEEFYVEKGCVIYLEAGIEKELAFNGTGIGRILGARLSGESFFILRLFNVSNIPRKVVIGSKFGLLPVKLNGETMICHRGVYVGSNNRVNVTTKLSIAGAWVFSCKRFREVPLYFLTQKALPLLSICNMERLSMWMRII